MARREFGVKEVVGAARTVLRNGAVRLRNAVVSAIPGERPSWVVVELGGSFPARRKKRRLLSLENLAGGDKESSLEELSAVIESLSDAHTVKGVVFRIQDLRVGLATAFALRNLLLRLRGAGKRVVVAADTLGTTNYYLASAADEIVVPESAELWVHGMAMSTTFMAEALSRFGVRFEKLAIREYKNAGDQLARSSMSSGQREQYEALLDNIEETVLTAVASARGRDPAEVRSWIDSGVTQAHAARDIGMVDRVAYEDEVITDGHAPAAKAVAFLPGRVEARGGRVAVVSLEGNIVPGKSRRSPIPLPVFGDAMAGSETLVRSLRTAGRDASTEAVVIHVDSGGGSALASDLIWREVKLLAARMPVVAVMGQLAASGGYYVLTHATRVLAAPTTLTGSIGVLSAKFVLEEFNERYGLNPETLRRGRFSSLMSFSQAWDEPESELMSRYIEEVYQRFVARVAEGRGLTTERVDEIGRGRVWSGAEALEVGLVDELGDVPTAIRRAKELARLPADAPVWNVPAQPKMVLPVRADHETVLRALDPLVKERVLLMHGSALRLR